MRASGLSHMVLYFCHSTDRIYGHLPLLGKISWLFKKDKILGKSLRTRDLERFLGGVGPEARKEICLGPNSNAQLGGSNAWGWFYCLPEAGQGLETCPERVLSGGQAMCSVSLPCLPGVFIPSSSAGPWFQGVG